MWWRSLLITSIFLLVAGVCFMLWENRSYKATPAAAAAQTDTLVMTNVFAGGNPAETLPGDKTHTREELSGYDINEGKRLYHWFNCNTCHANGGGDIGPPLMDDKWLYGAQSRNLYASILEGRPNGMPSFRGKIPDAQVWQIVAYIRSMSGKVPLYAKPSRNDDIQAKKPETRTPEEPVHKGGTPAPDRRSTNK
jgi:cytochrome c oxidase cbb3-type subunit 3